MIIDLSFMTGDLVMSGVIAFLAGVVSVMVYGRLKSFGKHDYRADDAVVEAVVLEYTRRLRDYDRVIAELRTKMDIVEMRIERPGPLANGVIVASQPAQPSRQVEYHAQAVSEPVTVTQLATKGERPQGLNGTVDYILKLLAERPRTSREIQQAIGRTREHTARLMKKLHDSGLVNRDVNAKPFRYAVTDQGRKRLVQRVEVVAEMPPPA